MDSYVYGCYSSLCGWLCTSYMAEDIKATNHCVSHHLLSLDDSSPGESVPHQVLSIPKKHSVVQVCQLAVNILFLCCQQDSGRYPFDSAPAFYPRMKDVSLLLSACLADKTSFRVHGVLSCPVMFCPTWTAILWAGVEPMGWMTFVTPILVCSLGGLAQAEARGADVSWEVWEVFSHSAHIWAYLLGCCCAANGGVNDMPLVMGYTCAHARVGVLRNGLLVNQHQTLRGRPSAFLFRHVSRTVKVIFSSCCPGSCHPLTLITTEHRGNKHSASGCVERAAFVFNSCSGMFSV